MKKIETPYLLFALVFGFMALIAPYLMEEYRFTLEGRLSMFMFQAGMEFACALATAKHLHDKWVQEDILDRQARLRVPKHADEETPPESGSTASASSAMDPGDSPDAGTSTPASGAAHHTPPA